MLLLLLYIFDCFRAEMLGYCDLLSLFLNVQDHSEIHIEHLLTWGKRYLHHNFTQCSSPNIIPLNCHLLKITWCFHWLKIMTIWCTHGCIFPQIFIEIRSKTTEKLTNLCLSLRQKYQASKLGRCTATYDVALAGRPTMPTS